MALDSPCLINPSLEEFSQWWIAQHHVLLAPNSKLLEAELLSRHLTRCITQTADNLNGPQEPCCFFLTSGTEGNPTWIALTRNALEISASVVNRHLHIQKDDRWLLALPPYHVGGFSILVRAHLAGNPVFFYEKNWCPEAFTSFCNHCRVTLTALVPTQVYDIVHNNISAPESLRVVIVGGGNLAPALAENAWRLGWPVIPTYGMTEAASQIATLALPPHGQMPENFEWLTILEHWCCDTDECGRLTIRGPALAQGKFSYSLNGRLWKWEKIDPSGYPTRDRVELRRQGNITYLRFLGRDASWVKILGELVNIDALRRQLDCILNLEQLPGRATIIAVPDTRAGQKLEMVTDLALPLAERIYHKYNSSQPGLTRCSSLRCVSHLPKSSLGKILISQLSHPTT